MVNQINSIMYNLELLNEKNSKVTYGLSSGNAIQNGSDDSSLYNTILSIKNSLNSYDSIQTNIESVSSYNSMADSNIASIKTVMESINTEILKANTDTTTQSEREIIASQIEAYKETIYDLVNDTSNGQYLFSGVDTSTQPFVMDETTGVVSYVGSTTNKTVNVEQGKYQEIGVTGYDLMYYTDETTTPSTQQSYFDDLDELIAALKLEDTNGNTITSDEADSLLSSALDKFDSAYDNVNAAHALVGTRTNTVDNYSEIVTSKITHFKLLQEEYASADLTALAVESQALENTYTALYSTINKINSMSLVNFLS